MVVQGRKNHDVADIEGSELKSISMKPVLKWEVHLTLAAGSITSRLQADQLCQSFIFSMQIHSGNSVAELLCGYLDSTLQSFNVFLVLTVEIVHFIKNLLYSYIAVTMTEVLNTIPLLHCFKTRKQKL